METKLENLVFQTPVQKKNETVLDYLDCGKINAFADTTITTFFLEICIVKEIMLITDVIFCAILIMGE